MTAETYSKRHRRQRQHLKQVYSRDMRDALYQMEKQAKQACRLPEGTIVSLSDREYEVQRNGEWRRMILRKVRFY